MGFLSKIFGSSIADPINAIGNVIDKCFTSDDERLQAQVVLEKLRQHPQELQVELNKLEAQHRSIFVSGWRPFIGWTCGICLACFFIPQFILAAFIWVKLCLAKNALLPYPIDGRQLFDIVISLLGLGALRTAEKFGNKTK